MAILPFILCILCFDHPQAPGMEFPASFVVNGFGVCRAHVHLARKHTTLGEMRAEMIHEYRHRMKAA